MFDPCNECHTMNTVNSVATNSWIVCSTHASISTLSGTHQLVKLDWTVGTVLSQWLSLYGFILSPKVWYLMIISTLRDLYHKNAQFTSTNDALEFMLLCWVHLKHIKSCSIELIIYHTWNLQLFLKDLSNFFMRISWLFFHGLSETLDKTLKKIHPPHWQFSHQSIHFRGMSDCLLC